MDIKEAIIHARQVAEGCGVDSHDCAYQHDYLADWLEELQAYRALGTVEELSALVKAREEGRVAILPEKVTEYAKQTSVELDCMTNIHEPCGDFKVKPCPFCGSKNIVYWQYRHAAGLRWRIACTHCLAMIDPGWVQEYGYLAKIWNTRVEAERALEAKREC